MTAVPVPAVHSRDSPAECVGDSSDSERAWAWASGDGNSAADDSVAVAVAAVVGDVVVDDGALSPSASAPSRCV